MKAEGKKFLVSLVANSVLAIATAAIICTTNTSGGQWAMFFAMLFFIISGSLLVMNLLWGAIIIWSHYRAGVISYLGKPEEHSSIVIRSLGRFHKWMNTDDKA